MRFLKTLIFGTAVSCAFACSEVPPTNPYDPQTPAASRAKATVKGTIYRQPCGGGDAVPAMGAMVSAERNGQVVKTVNVDETGAYVLSELIEGEYILSIALERYVGVNRVAVGRAGESGTLDRVTLAPS